MISSKPGKGCAGQPAVDAGRLEIRWYCSSNNKVKYTSCPQNIKFGGWFGVPWVH